jgi:hypothetical protein
MNEDSHLEMDYEDRFMEATDHIYEDEDEDEEEPEPKFFLRGDSPAKFVNAYELWRCFGGFEEGGWWYDEGRFMFSVICPEDEVPEVLAGLKALHPEPAVGRSGQHYCSVLYDGGHVIFRVEDGPGEDWPVKKPRYE